MSIATTRRHVAALASQGRVSREHGVAILTPNKPGAVTTPMPQAKDTTIGVIVAHNTYLEIVAEALRREASRRNVRALVEVVRSSEQIEAAHHRLRRAGCFGMVFAPEWGTPEDVDRPLPFRADESMPVVLAGRDVDMGHPLFGVDSVVADHAYAIRLAVEHLHRLGHRRILFAVMAGAFTSRLLSERFDAECRRLTLPTLRPALTTPGLGGSFEAILTSITEHEATAIIVHTETRALDMVREMRRHGWRVPQDCSVVGYDDLVGPVDGIGLTTVSPPKHQLAYEVMSLLMRRHARMRAGLDAPPVTHVRLLPDLVVRDSTSVVDISRR